MTHVGGPTAVATTNDTHADEPESEKKKQRNKVATQEPHAWPLDPMAWISQGRYHLISLISREADISDIMISLISAAVDISCS